MADAQKPAAASKAVCVADQPEINAIGSAAATLNRDRLNKPIAQPTVKKICLRHWVNRVW
jgi:hypothetical protein